MPPSIDVVTIAEERIDLAERCLRRLRAQSVAHSLTLVVGDSIGATRERLRARWPDVAIERCAVEGDSASRACNRVVAKGSGEILVLLDVDIGCSPDFLERLSAPFSDPEVGSAAPLLVQAGGGAIESVGLCADAFLTPVARLRGMPVEKAADPRPALLGPMGLAGAYRRSAWEQIGGLDEAMSSATSQLDLALRLRIAGWEAVARPDAVGERHGIAAFTRASAPTRLRAGFGRGYMVRRYGLLRERGATRVLAIESTATLGDLLATRDLAAFRGFLAGWRAGRERPQLPLPPERCLERRVGPCARWP